MKSMIKMILYFAIAVIGAIAIIVLNTSPIPLSTPSLGFLIEVNQEKTKVFLFQFPFLPEEERGFTFIKLRHQSRIDEKNGITVTVGERVKLKLFPKKEGIGRGIRGPGKTFFPKAELTIDTTAMEVPIVWHNDFDSGEKISRVIVTAHNTPLPEELYFLQLSE